MKQCKLWDSTTPEDDYDRSEGTSECKNQISGDENMVNAHAFTDGAGLWGIVFYKGLAMRHELGPEGLGAFEGDGFSLIACHEVGHLFAGFPFKLSMVGSIPLSTEGLSDYFATNQCLPRLWAHNRALSSSSYPTEKDVKRNIKNNALAAGRLDVLLEQNKITKKRLQLYKRRLH